MRELLTRDASTNLGHWVHETIVNSWREYQPGTLSTWDNCYLVTRVPTWDTEYMRELLTRDASTNLGHWVHERIVNSWREYQPGTLSTWDNCYLVTRVPTWDTEYMRQLLSRDASTNLGHWVHERILNLWREYQPGTQYMRESLTRDASTNLGHWVHERIVISWREYQPGTLSTWDNCYLVTRVPTWDTEYMRELLTCDASTNLGHWVHERIVNLWREYQPGTLSTWENC